MKTWSKIGIVWLVLAGLCVSLLAACGGDDKEEPAEQTTPAGKTVVPTGERTKIVIGNITDMTGPAAVFMTTVDMGLADIVRYYNDNDLIPGVEVELMNYDAQFDPAKDKPAWEWLKAKGADIMLGQMTYHPMSLGALGEQDKTPVLVAQAPSNLLETPGYMFAGAPAPEDLTWNMMQWIMNNHWDYRSKGPAKVGLAADEGGVPSELIKGFEAYARMYPERMKWAGAQIIPMGSYNWGNAAEALKDCDYIWTPNMFPMFIREYASSYSKAVFLGADNQGSFMKIANDMGIWPSMDGMLFIFQTEWWDEDAELPNLIKTLIDRYRPGELAKIMEGGKGYMSVPNGMMILESIRNAAAAVGPENVDSEAIYEGAQSMKILFDGVQRFSFTETKRSGVDRLAIYEVDSSRKTMSRVSEWFPVEHAALP